MIKSQAVALPHTLRALPLLSLGAIGALVAAPTLMTVSRSGHDLGPALTAAAVLGGAGLAYAVDDDAAIVLAASPSTLVARRAARVLAATLVIAISWAVVVAIGWSADLLSEQELGDFAVEAVTAAGVGIATAAWVNRDLEMVRTGIVGAATAVVLMVLLSGLALRYRWLPSLGTPGNHDRWLWIAALAWVGVWWTARDPAKRRHMGLDV